MVGSCCIVAHELMNGFQETGCAMLTYADWMCNEKQKQNVKIHILKLNQQKSKHGLRCWDPKRVDPTFPTMQLSSIFLLDLIHLWSASSFKQPFTNPVFVGNLALGIHSRIMNHPRKQYSTWANYCILCILCSQTQHLETKGFFSQAIKMEDSVSLVRNLHASSLLEIIL